MGRQLLQLKFAFQEHHLVSTVKYELKEKIVENDAQASGLGD